MTSKDVCRQMRAELFRQSYLLKADGGDGVSTSITVDVAEQVWDSLRSQLMIRVQPVKAAIEGKVYRKTLGSRAAE